MKFTVDAEPFRRLLEMLAQARPGGRRKYAHVRLEASRGRLRVQCDQLTAEIDSQVWQDGSCAVSFGRLADAVGACGASERLHAEVDDECDRLRVGESLLPCIAMERQRLYMPAMCRIFFASDQGVVSFARA